VIAGFGASLVHHTGAFFAWLWLIAAMIGSIGQAGLHITALGQHVSTYSRSIGADHWQGLLALLTIPALAIAIWRSRRAYQTLHAWAAQHRHVADVTS
jgi:hypothetical protein